MSSFTVSPCDIDFFPIRFYDLDTLSIDELEIFLDAFRGQVLRKSGKGAKANKGVKDERVRGCKGLVLYASDELQRKRYLKSFNTISKMYPTIRVVKGRARPKKNTRQWFYLVDEKDAA